MSNLTLPRLRKHVPSGRAVVTVKMPGGTRRDFYCGPYGSAGARDEYKRICTLLIANDGLYPSQKSDLTVAEAVLAYVRFAERYYGKGTSGLSKVKRSIRAVRTLYSGTSAAEFGPKALKVVQEHWVAEDITRKSINGMTGAVKQAFRWMVSEEMLPADVFHRLQAVTGLRLGRTTALDNPPVRPADPADLHKAVAFMPPMIAAICELQVRSGARCGELLRLKGEDLDRSGLVWRFEPAAHKGTWRGKSRMLYFGPRAQAVLAPFILKSGGGYLFSPVIGEAERNAVKSAKRATPRYPSHLARNACKRVGKRRRRPPGETYTTGTVRRAIERACDLAGVERFTPHRLRHLAALTIREELGIEHARAALGHTVAAMTEHYSRVGGGGIVQRGAGGK